MRRLRAEPWHKPGVLLDDRAGHAREGDRAEGRAGELWHDADVAGTISPRRSGNSRLRVLDGLVRYRFGDNPELMGAWTSARHVLGPFKSKGEPDHGAGQTPGGGSR